MFKKVIIYLFFVLQYKKVYGKSSILNMLFYVMLKTKEKPRESMRFFSRTPKSVMKHKTESAFVFSFKHNDHLAIFIKENVCFIGKLLR